MFKRLFPLAESKKVNAVELIEQIGASLTRDYNRVCVFDKFVGFIWSEVRAPGDLIAEACLLWPSEFADFIERAKGNPGKKYVTVH